MNRLSRLLIIAVAGAVLASLTACSTRIKSPPGMTTTVVLVRHAERDYTEDALVPEGVARAAALPAAVKQLNFAAIYSPDKKRNMATVKPLATERGLPITVIPVSNAAKRMVRDHPGKTVLWVGNTTNLPAIFRLLGGEGAPPNNYGDLFILHVPDTGTTVVERRHFGK